MLNFVHGGSSAGSYLADPTSPIPSHCASIVATITLRVNIQAYFHKACLSCFSQGSQSAPTGCWNQWAVATIFTLGRPGRVLYLNSYSASHNNWCTATLWNRIMTEQCEGMGEVGSARYEPALLPPYPSIRALCYSNCQRSTQSQQQSKG